MPSSSTAEEQPPIPSLSTAEEQPPVPSLSTAEEQPPVPSLYTAEEQPPVPSSSTAQEQPPIPSSSAAENTLNSPPEQLPIPSSSAADKPMPPPEQLPKGKTKAVSQVLLRITLMLMIQLLQKMILFTRVDDVNYMEVSEILVPDKDPCQFTESETKDLWMFVKNQLTARNMFLYPDSGKFTGNNIKSGLVASLHKKEFYFAHNSPKIWDGVQLYFRKRSAGQVGLADDDEALARRKSCRTR
jgi:hypothetical protein